MLWSFLKKMQILLRGNPSPYLTDEVSGREIIEKREVHWKYIKKQENLHSSTRSQFAESEFFYQLLEKTSMH